MDLTQYVIIGAIVSAVTQLIKNLYWTNEEVTRLIVVGLAVVCGGVYYFIQDTNLIEPILAILGFASAVYQFLIKRFN